MYLKKINLKNKTALVTGAGKGIGKACSIALAEAGANLIIISFIFASDRLSYNNCMVQTKLKYISKKGAKHVGAICKAFILERIMIK